MLTQADIDTAAELCRLQEIEERGKALISEKLDMARKSMQMASKAGTLIGQTMWAKESDRYQQEAVEIAGILGLVDLPDIWGLYPDEGAVEPKLDPETCLSRDRPVCPSVCWGCA